ncbi:hypothetical protein FGF67_09705 [Tamlana fucoidanivorans]|uniref:Uncharacterized protein n=1 Tax=Allotamlana fucoidanivorans TaxID=2583814 RepID=A0A5C4SL73_9FLAO|nr:hypothetical protein FGF67_09705 [Tamlana fucoidanivorans]
MAQSQEPIDVTNEPQRDSINKNLLLKSIGNGYFPTKYFNFDLRYLVKYNHYEGIRTGLGGVTNHTFSEKFRFNTYAVYGFRDHRFKYSFGGGIRLAQKTNTWLNATYTDDLQETGSTRYITDSRVFQFFEPRLLNIDLFHKHITTAVAIEHQIAPHLLSEAEFAVSNIEPTYSYNYLLNDTSYHSFNITTGIVGFQWSPFSKFEPTPIGMRETKSGFPKFSFQYTKSFKNAFKGDFDFSKFDFKVIEKIGQNPNHYGQITLVTGMAIGDAPLTHLYHAYPNNITKEKILQRFTVAGLNSFETMYFNEFFSDKFATIQFRYFLPPFQISDKLKPQLVLISRYAIGDMDNPERHDNITFSSLKHGFTESGFEFNKLLFGFGLSFTYRYGAYHLPNISDNVAFKFTFNVSF